MSDELTRRRFLETTGGIAAAATVAALDADSSCAADEKPPAHGLRKALKYSMISGKGSVLDKFKLAKAAGFEGVDINVRLDHDEVNKAQAITKLKVHGVVAYDHWTKPLSHPDAAVRKTSLESLLGAIRDAKAYGGTTVLLVPAVVNKDISYADAYKRSQAEIRKALPLAEELGIRILFENVWNNFLLSPVEMARYIDEFDSKLVGAYFDVGNVVRFGWPEHWIQALGSRIGKLDIKEYSRKLQHSKGPGAGFRVKLGEGDCDWPAVMQSLSDIGFKGWATAEVSGGGAERLNDISQRMDRIFVSST
jgi:hexulose-6-phosphate isomerase